MVSHTVARRSDGRGSAHWTGRLTMRGWWPSVASAKPDVAVAPSCEFDYDYYVCLAERRRSRARR